MNLQAIGETFKTIGDIAKSAQEVFSLAGTAGPLIGVLISKGKQAWTYLVGRKEEDLTVKDDVAILVQVIRPSAVDVKNYLEENNIDAPLYIVSNSEAKENEIGVARIDDRDRRAWKAVAKDFANEIAKIQKRYGAKQYHIFIAAPSVLAFALGCSVGTLYRMKLYNWLRDESTYVEVLAIPHDLQ